MSNTICIFQEKREGDVWNYDGEFPYDGQDYELFGWLNGSEFKTPFTSIAKSRGLPDDIAKETRDRIEGVMGEEGFGESWLTFKEILDDVEGDPEKANRFEEFLSSVRLITETDDPELHRIVFCFII